MTKSSAKPDIIEQHWSHVIQHLFRSLPSSSENCTLLESQKPSACETEEPSNSESFRPSYSLYCERNNPSEVSSADKENVDNGLSRLIRELVIEAPLIECAGTKHYISEKGAIKVPGGERRTRRRPPSPLNEENDDLAPLLVAQGNSSSDEEDPEPEVEDEEVEDEESESDEEGLDFDEALASKLVPLGERKKTKAKKLKNETGESASVEKRQSTSQDADSEHSSDEEDNQVSEEQPKKVIRKRRNTDDDDDSQGGRSAKEQLLAV